MLVAAAPRDHALAGVLAEESIQFPTWAWALLVPMTVYVAHWPKTSFLSTP